MIVTTRMFLDACPECAYPVIAGRCSSCGLVIDDCNITFDAGSNVHFSQDAIVEDHFPMHARTGRAPGRPRQFSAPERAEHQREYYRQHAAEIAEHRREYYRQHAAERREYYRRHAAEITEHQREYYRQH